MTHRNGDIGASSQFKSSSNLVPLQIYYNVKPSQNILFVGMQMHACICISVTPV